MLTAGSGRLEMSKDKRQAGKEKEEETKGE